MIGELYSVDTSHSGLGVTLTRFEDSKQVFLQGDDSFRFLELLEELEPMGTAEEYEAFCKAFNCLCGGYFDE